MIKIIKVLYKTVKLAEYLHPQINIANTSDNDIRRTIEDHVGRFLRKIHGKQENIQSVPVYVDRYDP